MNKSDLLIRPREYFSRDGQKKLSAAIVNERHKAHLDTQGEFVRVVLEARAEMVWKQKQKAEAQRELREKVMKERRKHRRALRVATAQEEGCSLEQADATEVNELSGGAVSACDTGTHRPEGDGGESNLVSSEMESIRDIEDRKEKMLEEEERKFQAKRVQIAREKMIRVGELRRAQAVSQAENHAEETLRQKMVAMKEEQHKQHLLEHRFGQEKVRLQRVEEKQQAEVKLREQAIAQQLQMQEAWQRAEEKRLEREKIFTLRKLSFVERRAQKMKRIEVERSQTLSNIAEAGEKAEKERKRAEKKREKRAAERQSRLKRENAAQREEQEARAQKIREAEKLARQNHREKLEQHIREVEMRQLSAAQTAERERSRKIQEDFANRAAMREEKQKRAKGAVLARVAAHEETQQRAAERQMVLQEQAAAQQELMSERLRLAHIKKEAHIKRLARRREYQREQNLAKLQKKQEQMSTHQDRREGITARRKAAAQRFLMAELEMRREAAAGQERLRFENIEITLSPKQPIAPQQRRTPSRTINDSEGETGCEGPRTQRLRQLHSQKESALRLACPPLPSLQKQSHPEKSCEVDAEVDVFERAQQWLIQLENPNRRRQTKPSSQPKGGASGGNSGGGGRKPGADGSKRGVGDTRSQRSLDSAVNVLPRGKGYDLEDDEDDDDESSDYGSVDDFDDDQFDEAIKPSPLAALLEAAVTDSKGKIGVLTDTHLAEMDRAKNVAQGGIIMEALNGDLRAEWVRKKDELSKAEATKMSVLATR